MKGEGAIVFLVVFFAMLLVTLGSPSVPPGKQLYGKLGVPETSYQLHGVSITTLIYAIFNGVIYGVVAWVIFTFGKIVLRH